MNALDHAVQYPDLLELCQRAIDHDDCYIELHVAGLTLNVFPGRINPSLARKERLSIFAGFMLALAEEVETPPVRIALLHGAAAIGAPTQIGLAMSPKDSFLDMVWVPAQVIGINRAEIPSVAFFDMRGNAIVEPGLFRKIRL